MSTLRAVLILAIGWFLAPVAPASAQPTGQGAMQGMSGMPCPYGCPMCGMMDGPMGGVMMVLAWVLVLAVISVLVALTVFLIRRSRPTK